MKHRLLTTAAALSGAPAAAAPVVITAPAPPVPSAVVEDEVDVVRADEARAAVAAAEQRGAATERQRFSAVMASEPAKANMTMAAWMVSNNPAASAESIVKALGDLPVAAGAPVVAAPAAPAATAPAPAAPVAITTPLTETPKVVIGTQPSGTATSQSDIDKGWDQALASVGDAGSNAFGPEIRPGLPRTGN